MKSYLSFIFILLLSFGFVSSFEVIQESNENNWGVCGFGETMVYNLDGQYLTSNTFSQYVSGDYVGFCNCPVKSDGNDCTGKEDWKINSCHDLSSIYSQENYNKCVSDGLSFNGLASYLCLSRDFSSCSYCSGETPCGTYPNCHFASEWYSDADNDGYSNFTSVLSCERPSSSWKNLSELSSTSIDCDDSLGAFNTLCPLKDYEVKIDATPGLVWTNKDFGANCEPINSSTLAQYNPMKTPVFGSWESLYPFFKFYSFTDGCNIDGNRWFVPSLDNWVSLFRHNINYQQNYLDALSSLGLSENIRYWTSDKYSFGPGKGVWQVYLNSLSKQLEFPENTNYKTSTSEMLVSPYYFYSAANYLMYCQEPLSSSLYSSPVGGPFLSTPRKNNYAASLDFPGFESQDVPCPLALYRYVRCEEENVPKCISESAYSVCNDAVFSMVSCGAGEVCSDGNCVCNTSEKKCVDGRTVSSCDLSSGQWKNSLCSSGEECQGNGECVKTCRASGGNICSEDQRCDGSELNVQDSDRCCSGSCVMPTPKKCSDCGEGIFNTCDKNECENLVGGESDGCIFMENGFFSNLFGERNCKSPDECVGDECGGKQVCLSGNCKNVDMLSDCYKSLSSSNYYLLSKNLTMNADSAMGNSCLNISSANNVVVNGRDYSINLNSDSPSGNYVLYSPLNRQGIFVGFSDGVILKNLVLKYNSARDGRPSGVYDTIEGISILQSKGISIINNSVDFNVSSSSTSYFGIRSMRGGINTLSNNSIQLVSGTGIYLLGSVGSGSNYSFGDFAISSFDNNLVQTKDNSLILDAESIIFGEDNGLNQVRLSNSLIGFDYGNKNVVLTKPVTLSLSPSFDELKNSIFVVKNNSVYVRNTSEKSSCELCKSFAGNEIVVSFKGNYPLPRDDANYEGDYYFPSEDYAGMDKWRKCDGLGFTRVYENSKYINSDGRFYYDGGYSEPSNVIFNKLSDSNEDCYIDGDKLELRIKL